MRKLFIFILCFLTSVIANINISSAEQSSEKSIKQKISHKGVEQIEIPPTLIVRKTKKRDISLMISVESVLQKLKGKQKPLLIDVRNKEKFEKIRIPGSVNIPLFTIKTKTFLKSKPLVLVNEGYRYSTLEQTCNILINSGFTSVFILNGGLSYWGEKIGNLEGDVFKQKELNKVPPQIFFTEKDYDNWTVIDVSKTKEDGTDNLIPQNIHIPYNPGNSKEFVLKFKTLVNKRKNDPFPTILIFNEDGKSYEKIEKLVKEIGTSFVFYLKGGFEGYKKFLEQQVQIWQTKGKIKNKKCRSCS